MNDEKAEFCSRGWVDYAREFLQCFAEGADLEGVDVTSNEVFTDAPAHLEPDSGGRVG